jgi:hypothetical protein
MLGGYENEMAQDDQKGCVWRFPALVIWEVLYTWPHIVGSTSENGIVYRIWIEEKTAWAIEPTCHILSYYRLSV